MVLKTHRPEERARIQSINGHLVFGSVAVGSFLSGDMLKATYGWEVVCWLVIPPAAVALVALIMFSRRGAVIAGGYARRRN